MATPLTNLKKSRSANRNVIKAFILKAKDMTHKPYSENIRVDIEATLKAIEFKRKTIADTDVKIIELLEEASIEADVEETGQFELECMIDIGRLEDYLASKKLKQKVVIKDEEAKKDVASGGSEMVKAGVKLPKIHIKKFFGDPTTWQQFFETFEATVHMNSSLSDVEKFSYLKGYLGGAAERSIEGIPLSNDNYDIALNLLKERYANPQLIIASHIRGRR